MPIGDFYTMGPEDALTAAKWLGAQNYLPIHYNTFDLLKQDGAEFARRVEAECPGARCFAVRPGESIELD